MIRFHDDDDDDEDWFEDPSAGPMVVWLSVNRPNVPKLHVYTNRKR